jgi:dihydrofolate reductase
MTDKDRVLGASTPEGDALRLRLLPQGLQAATQAMLVSDNLAFGMGSAKFYASSRFARNETYVITRDKTYRPSTSVKDCHDYTQLVERLQHSEDELNVIGGRTILKLFTPLAQELDVAEKTELVPGDLILGIHIQWRAMKYIAGVRVPSRPTFPLSSRTGLNVHCSHQVVRNEGVFCTVHIRRTGTPATRQSRQQCPALPRWRYHCPLAPTPISNDGVQVTISETSRFRSVTFYAGLANVEK